jgi:predicted RNA-binding Zn-ribbon protein involved in translation (DUF1610 family)
VVSIDAQTNIRRIVMSDNQRKEADECFCSSCGAVIKREAEICPKCGVRQKKSSSISEASMNYNTLLWLSILLGEFGVDHFYVGKTGSGILKLCTLGGCGVWWILDIIKVFNGKFTDKDGNVIRKE